MRAPVAFLASRGIASETNIIYDHLQLLVCVVIHLITKWPPFKYYFLFIQISPWCLVLKLKIQKNILSWTRQQGQICMRINQRPFWNKVYKFLVKHLVIKTSDKKDTNSAHWNFWNSGMKGTRLKLFAETLLIVFILFTSYALHFRILLFLIARM